ncbi:MAG: hypothetical protein FD130_1407 [Halothiobacillaceae bacterium]|nr:MAG: hypothetical protein FD130_1407 [Halothiobacillaceae bacterium]
MWPVTAVRLTSRCFTARAYSLQPRSQASVQQGLAVYYDLNGGFRTTNQLADMNGDGITDIFRVTIAEAGSVKTLFGDASGNYRVEGPQQDAVIDPLEFIGTQFGQYFNYSNQLVDVNGDGVTDIVSAVKSSPDTQYIGERLSSGCSDPNQSCSKDIITANRNLYSAGLRVSLGKGDGAFVPASTTQGVIASDDLDLHFELSR